MSLLDRFLARIAPINTGDFTLQQIIGAITSPGELYDDLTQDSDTHSAWGKAMDPDYAPAPLLGWLAQFAGVSLLPSDDEATQRARIKAAAGFRRGTPGAMTDEVTPTLTGSQYTNILQQVGGNRWAMTLVTLSVETPNPAATYAAALRQKPAGIALTHVVATGPIVDLGTRTIDLGANTIDSAVLADVT